MATPVDVDKVLERLSKDQQEVVSAYNGLKVNVETFVKFVLNKVTSEIGAIPDEDTFIGLLSQYIDKLVDGDKLSDKATNPIVKVLWKIVELIDGPGIKFILKFALDKILGTGWFAKYSNMITSIK